MVVTVTTDDGVRLEGTLRRAQGPGAVLLVHDLGSRRSVYAPYAQLFFIDDLTTLSIDLRGHGNSRSDSLSSHESPCRQLGGTLVQTPWLQVGASAGHGS